MKKSHDDQVTIHKEPKLRSPSLLAAWPGVANVALEATTYLKDKLQAVEFAEIEAQSFFEVTGVYVEKNLIQSPRFPENKFYYWKRKGKEGDLIIFLGEAQPSTKNREFANMILDVVQRFGVKVVYTCAAALISHFPEQPRVWAAATDGELLDQMEKQGLVEKKHDLSRKNLVRVVVTPKGEEAFQRQRSVNTVANLTSTLTREEREALGTCVDKLRIRATELIRKMTPTPYDY